MMRAVLLCATALSTPAAAHAFLGWNAWFAFDVNLNDTVMRSNADGLVRLGLAAAGYTLVSLDGGWQGGRLPNGTVYPNATKFPRGLADLTAYIASRGLVAGAYTDRGQSTCDGHVGSLGHEAADAAYYASQGFSFVKEDSCGGIMDHDGALGQFALMQSALAATGVNFTFSLCGWLSWYPLAGLVTPTPIGNAWRIGPDALSWPNVVMNIDSAAGAAAAVGAGGGFPDLDEVMGPSRGRPISRAQTLTQLAMLAIVGSPVLISFDLSNISDPSDPDVAPFLNSGFLSVVQDPLPVPPQHRMPAASRPALDPAVEAAVLAARPDLATTSSPSASSSSGTTSSGSRIAAGSGPQYARLVGGYVNFAQIPPLTRLPCTVNSSTTDNNGSSTDSGNTNSGGGSSVNPAAQWEFLPVSFDPSTNSSTGYFASSGPGGAPGMCLTAGPAWTGTCNNAQQVWLAACGTGAGSSSSCCDANCTNQWFTLTPLNSSNSTNSTASSSSGSGIAVTVTTPYWPHNNNAAGPYMTLDPIPNGLYFQDRFNSSSNNSSSTGKYLPQDPAAQEWVWDSVAGTLSSAQPGGGCLGGAPRDSSNVWGRRLSDGSLALLLANFDPDAAQNITCDAACFAAAGYAGSSVFAVADIWAGSSNGTVAAAEGYSATVAANGASIFLRLTPTTTA